MLLLSILSSVPAWAQTAADTPISTRSEIGVGIFVAIFVAFCVGLGWYAWHMWSNEKDQEHDRRS